MSDWHHFLIGGLIGLLVGLERQKSHPHGSAMGVRTFTLLGLLGATSATLNSVWISASLAVASLLLIVGSYLTSGGDRGLTTEFAAALIFAVGYLAKDNPVLAGALGPLIALILISKSKLHQFTRNLKIEELQSAVLLLLLATTVLNVMPNRVIDPWGVFNPQKFGYLVLALAVLEFASYALCKIFGDRSGLIITGFLGGWVSSTAMVLSASRAVKAARGLRWHGQAAAVLAAVSASLIELLIILFAVEPKIAVSFLPAVGASVALGLVAAYAISRNASEARVSAAHVRSPLDWRGVLRLAIVMAMILAAVTLAKNVMGEEAILGVAFLTGLFELHGLALATGTLLSQGGLTFETAQLTLIIAVAASLIAKTGIVVVSNGRNAFVVTTALALLGMGAVFGSLGALALR